MKICDNCGASNPDADAICGECGAALEAVAEPRPASSEPRRTGGVTAADLARTIQGSRGVQSGGRKADIMFVLDCTGSMQGEIDAIRDAITAFADTIKSDGVRARVGLIEFRDRLVGEEPRVLDFGGSPFTSDPEAFRSEVSRLKATGGGDIPESSLDALMLALRQPFAPDGNKVIVLVTDAPPHIPDKETASIDQVAEQMRDQGLSQFYFVIQTQDSASQVYLKLLDSGVRGVGFELGRGSDFRSRAEHFKRTLMSLGKTISSATV